MPHWRAGAFCGDLKPTGWKTYGPAALARRELLRCRGASPNNWTGGLQCGGASLSAVLHGPAYAKPVPSRSTTQLCEEGCVAFILPVPLLFPLMFLIGGDHFGVFNPGDLSHPRYARPCQSRGLPLRAPRALAPEGNAVGPKPDRTA